MYHVMVVDDEVNIADLTAAYLSCLPDIELDLMTAYSAAEALHMLQKQPADVIVADIQMPGMDGLAMLREIRRLLPLCQFIILTAHERFTYAVDALKMDALDYVVKNEGMSRLGAAVRGAIRRIEDTASERRIRDAAREQARVAIPFMQRELVMDLAHGAVYTDEKLAEAQRHVAMPVDMLRPFIAAMVLIHAYEDELTLLDRMERAQSIWLIAQSYLPEGSSFAQTEIDTYRILWLIGMPHAREDSFISGYFEGVQRGLLQQLSLPISVTYTLACDGYQRFQNAYARLHAQQSTRAVSGMVSWIACVDYEADPPETVTISNTSAARAWRKAFERGAPDALDKLKAALAPLAMMGSITASNANECFHTVAAQFIRILKNMSLTEQQREDMRTHMLYDLSAHYSVKAAYDYLMNLASIIIAIRRESGSRTARSAIECVNRLISEDIGGDLSLTRLAGHVGMNASYLSRLYKQETGVNLTAYITRARMNKARSMLEDPTLKVQDVADALGFRNLTYFSYYFRCNQGMSPVKYRDMHISK